MHTEDLKLVTSFEQLTLPVNQWDQRAHVSVAFIYLREYGFDEALQRIRRGVRAFNQQNGIVDAPTSGYNETTTVAFLRIIRATDRAYNDVYPTTNSREFCDTHPQILCKHVLRFFYSPERRMHPDAKTKFVEPDLAPLPGNHSS